MEFSLLIEHFQTFIVGKKGMKKTIFKILTKGLKMASNRITILFIFFQKFPLQAVSLSVLLQVLLWLSLLKLGALTDQLNTWTE